MWRWSAVVGWAISGAPIRCLVMRSLLNGLITWSWPTRRRSITQRWRPSRRRDLPGASFVGYNLRFHPLLRELAHVLAGEHPISAHLYVGQYLPDWRPSRDYRHTASASRQAGGGVLRDLSHELDYLAWLFGPCERVAALGGRFSQLEIDCDDVQGLLLAFEHCPVVTAQLNYLDHEGRRSLIVNTAQRTIVADLVRSTLSIGGEEKSFKLGRDDTYLAQHRRIIGNSHEGLCTLAEGAAVLELIAAAESAAVTGQWVRL